MSRDSRFEVISRSMHGASEMMPAVDHSAPDAALPPPPRLAFFGGSFDPPHCGHLELARRVVKTAGLERLYFVPAARNPLKLNGPRAPGSLRVGMLEAAIEGDASLGVIDWELGRPPPSYTLETVAYLEERFPATERLWLIGADQLPGLPKWRRIGELVKRVRFLVLARPGASGRAPDIRGLRLQWVEAPLSPHSSTEVRRCLRKGLPVDNLVPLPVLDFIRQHPQLYR